MVSTYVELPEENNEYGNVYLDVENYIFYLIVEEKFLPEKQEIESVTMDFLGQKLFKHGYFNSFKLEQRSGVVIAEGYAIQIKGLSPGSLSQGILRQEGKLRWSDYINKLKENMDRNNSENFEKFIIIRQDADPNFNNNYVFVNHSIELQVIFRMTETDIQGNKKYCFFDYNNCDTNPEEPFRPTKLDPLTIHDIENCLFIPYTKEVWEELVNLADSYSLIMNRFDDFIKKHLG